MNLKDDLFLKINLLLIFIYPLVDPNISLGLSDIYIVLFLIHIIFKKDSRLKIWNGLKNIKNDKMTIAFLFMCIWTFISIFWAPNYMTSLPMALFYLSIALFYITLKYEYNDCETQEFFTKIFLLTSFFICSYLIYQYVEAEYIRKVAFDRTSQMSTLDNANIIAVYCLMSLFIAIDRIFNSKTLFKKGIYSFYTVLVFITIIIASSRAIFLGVLLGLFIITIKYKPKFIYALLGFIVLMIVVPSLRDRVLEIFSYEQNVLRVKIWTVAYDVTLAHPIIGTGVTGFVFAYSSYIKSHPKMFNIYDRKDIWHAHNMLLRFSSELGLIGLSSLLALIFLSLKSLSKYSSIEFKGKNRDLGAIYVTLVAFYFSNLLDSYFMSPKVMLVWAFLNVIYAGNLRFNKLNE